MVQGQTTPLVITKAVLKELDEKSVGQLIPQIDSLNYREAQQLMLLTALKQWIESHYDTKSQFEFNLGD